jgi:hypothetical protein
MVTDKDWGFFLSTYSPCFVHRQHIGYVSDRASSYYFFIVFVVIRYKTTTTAGRALAVIVRILVNDTIAIAVWTSFDAIGVWRSFHVLSVYLRVNG